MIYFLVTNVDAQKRVKIRKKEVYEVDKVLKNNVRNLDITQKIIIFIRKTHACTTGGKFFSGHYQKMR